MTNMPGHKRHKRFVCRQVFAQNLSKTVRVVLCVVHIPDKLVVKSLGPQTDVQPTLENLLRASPDPGAPRLHNLPYDLVAFSLRFVTRGRTAFSDSADLLLDCRYYCGYGRLRQMIVTAECCSKTLSCFVSLCSRPAEGVPKLVLTHCYVKTYRHNLPHCHAC